MPSERPIAGGPTPAPSRGATEFPPLDDLQSLLADTVRRLSAHADRVYAWARSDDGTVQTLAAAGPAQPNPQIDADGMGAIEAAGRALDLGSPEAMASARALAERSGLSAAAPIFAHDSTPIAILAVGGEEDPAGRVRPRTLARLQEATAQLRGPAAAAVSAERLARIDDEVRRLDRLSSLGTLLSEVAHELRNPLVSMKTFLQLLPERLNDPEFHTDFRKVVSDELNRMERLIDGVLRQARPATTRTDGRGTDVDALVRAMSQLLGQRAIDCGVTFALDIAPDPAAAAIAEDALRQVLLNLTLNALEATPSGGAVTLRVQTTEGDVEISVDDSGPGIASEDRERIFEPFFSSRSDRAGGLGLAISHRITAEAGGRIAVEDAPGGGARFRVRLPAAR